MATNNVKRMKKDNNQAASRISDLMDDVIRRIFLMFPAKSLLRLRWVCKYWLSLISNPSFVKLQLHHSTHDIMDNTSVLMYNDPTPNKRLVLRSFNMDEYNKRPVPQMKLPPPLLDSCVKFTILGSCNGLLCIQFSTCSSSFEMIFIWNPCTNETRTLPKPTFRSSTFAIDHGFGYDSHTDDYKVVLNTHIENEENKHYDIIVDVYSLGANSWKTIICTNMPGAYRILQSGVYANGAIYWSSLSGDGNILRFDLHKEEYTEVSKPLEVLQKYVKLGEYKGCLSILNLPTKNCLNIWVRMDNNGLKEDAWFKLFTITLPIQLVGCRSLYSYRPKLCKNDELLIASDEGYLVSCKPKYDKIRWFATKIKCKRYEIYTESLVSLNSRI